MGLKRLIVKIKNYISGKCHDHFALIYSRDANVNEDVEILPHGNSKYTSDRPYIRTSNKILEVEDQLLSSGYSVAEIYNKVLQESGEPLDSQLQSSKPRDKSLIYQWKNKKQKECTENNQTGDDLINSLNEPDLIQSIIIKKDSFFFPASNRQINDIVKFCCVGNNCSVLEIDTTYNLCDMWVTDPCYRNQRTANYTIGKHPVYLRPCIFRFTKDMNTFRRFGLEIQACNIRIRSVHKIGLDIEEAVLQGVASMFPDVHHLYCICHLMQRDEQKINCILQKLDCRENERLRPKKEILSDIYGERRRGLYEYGLEFSDAEEFSEKLASL